MVNVKRGALVQSSGKLSRFLLKLKSRKIFLFIPLFIILVIGSFILIPIIFQGSSKLSLMICGDGTFYDTCSLDKPYYCSEGILIESASVCGCPEGFIKSGDSCTSSHFTDGKEISLDYLVHGETGVINLTLYEGVVDYLSKIPNSINYQDGEKFFRVDFKLKKINDGVQRQALLPLVVAIQNLADDKDEQARIAVSVVQNIVWNSSGRTISFGGQSIDYSRYPYEVLFEESGICGEKSELLSFLLRELGFGTALFYYNEEDHEAVGVECPVKNSLDGTGYCFIETSGSAIISDSSMEYEGGLVLTSKPDVLLISEGVPLGDNLREYDDARKLTRINNVSRKRSWIGPFWLRTINKFKERYGLIDSYNSG